MELKPDLIRDMLLFSEALPLEGTMSKEVIINSDYLKKYSEDEILHAIQTIGNNDAHLINAYVKYASNKPYIWFVGSPTFAGASYLENIKDDAIWKAVKKKTSSIAGGVSLQILGMLAENLIKTKLGLL